jgi:hypothetical protein
MNLKPIRKKKERKGETFWGVTLSETTDNHPDSGPHLAFPDLEYYLLAAKTLHADRPLSDPL